MISSHPSSNAERVYAFDALRGIMMLLGIVIHASITYGSIDYKAAWPLKDPDNSLFFDLLVAFIHAFRMPVFFVAAGYFAALLYYRKGPNAMLLNRFKRIVLPFLAGLLVTFPLIVMAFTYSNAAFAGSKTPFSDAWKFLVDGNFPPFNVAHLWFLYFLAFYAVAGWLVAQAFQKKTVFTNSANKIFAHIFQSFWLRLLCMAAVLFACLYWMGTPFLMPSNDWKIDPPIFVTYFAFFGMGWMIFKTDILIKLTSFPAWQLSVATLLFLVSSMITWPSATWVLPVQMLFTSVYISLFIFGFIAFFLNYFNHYSKRLSYLMDSAYWVYIIHLPVVSFIPGLLAEFSLPAFVKFLITLLTTSVICLVSYKFLVRGTVIGMFLNGKVHKRRKAYPAQELVVQS